MTDIRVSLSGSKDLCVITISSKDSLSNSDIASILEKISENLKENRIEEDRDNAAGS